MTRIPVVLVGLHPDVLQAWRDMIDSAARSEWGQAIERAYELHRPPIVNVPQAPLRPTNKKPAALTPRAQRKGWKR